MVTGFRTACGNTSTNHLLGPTFDTHVQRMYGTGDPLQTSSHTNGPTSRKVSKFLLNNSLLVYTCESGLEWEEINPSA